MTPAFSFPDAGFAAMVCRATLIFVGCLVNLGCWIDANASPLNVLVIIISRIAKAVSLERTDSPGAPGLGRQKPIKPRRQRTGAWNAKT